MQIKIGDGIALIRSKDGLSQWSDLQIHQAIDKAIDECAMTYSVDNEGKIDGIVFGKWTSFDYNNEPLEFHVIYITGNLKMFWSYLRRVFPSCKHITGLRENKLTKYTV